MSGQPKHVPHRSDDGRTTETEGRRERNKREKLTRIVSAARTLFRTQGYAATTTQQIAQAAGIAAGTLFLYARTKEDLVVLVFKREMDQLIEDTYRTVGQDGSLLERTLGLFGGFIDYHGQDVAVARELIRSLTFLSSEDRIDDMNQLTNAIVGKLSRFVIAAKAAGEIPDDVDTRVFARCLFAIYYQQLQTWLSGYVDRETFERSLKAMLTTVIG